MSLMDSIMAKALQDKPLAYAESGIVLTFDGNMDNAFEADGGKWVKISDAFYDAEKLSSVTLTNNVGVSNNPPMSEFLVESIDDGWLLVWGPGLIAAVFENDIDPTVTAGTYAVVHEEVLDSFTAYLWPSCIEFAETIHPIDPKYIPALDSLTLNGADGKQYKVAVDSNGTLFSQAVGGQAIGSYKEIDLDAYIDTDAPATYSIEQVILLLVSGGGGTLTLKVPEFWADVTVSKPLHLKLNHLNNRYFDIYAPIVYRDSSRVYQIAFNALLYDASIDKTLNITVSINRADSTDADIRVSVN